MAAVDAAIETQFESFRAHLDDSGTLRERIRNVATEIESVTRLMLLFSSFSSLAPFQMVIDIFNFCASNGEAFPGCDILLCIGCKLGETRIILCEPGYKHRLQKLQLNFPNDDVVFALKDCKEIPWLAKYL